VPRVYITFRSPTYGSDGYYAASVAAAVLGLKKGSRLHRSLVRDQQLASEANAFTFDLAKGADLLIVDVTARPGTSADDLERAAVAEIDRFMAEGASEAEVERAVALIETEFVSSLQSAGDRADKLSMFATYLGDPSRINTHVDRFRAVTASQVSRFARERLGAAHRATLVYQVKVGDLVTADV
jgi:predicted Zn-dependent peptidase